MCVCQREQREVSVEAQIRVQCKAYNIEVQHYPHELLPPLSLLPAYDLKVVILWMFYMYSLTINIMEI